MIKESKTCTKCGITQSRSEFHKKSDAPDGLQNRCKACQRAYNEANKEKRKARAETAMAANKEKRKARAETARATNKGKPKTCNKCEKAQSRSEFYKSSSAPDGLSYNCKTCILSYKETNKEKLRARAETAIAANKGKPKTCTKCGITQSRSEFHKKSDAPDGLSYNCKTCVGSYGSKYNETIKEGRKARSEAAIETNKGKPKTCTKCGITQPRSKFHKKTDTLDGLNKYCKTCRLADREANKEKLRARAETARAANKGKPKTCNKCEKAQSRSEFSKSPATPDGLRYNCKTCSKAADPKLRLRKNIVKAIRKALKKQGKPSKRSFEKLPYDLKQVTEHIEGQFDEHMTWENYGSYWQIDHIYPQSRLLYDSYDHENFQKCWALSNLQPLEASENYRKGNKIIDS